MFRVEWLDAALDDLSAIWMEATPAERQSVTSACHELDQRLARNPLDESESRPNDLRIAFAPPLTVRIRVDTSHNLVVVLRANMYRRRPS